MLAKIAIRNILRNRRRSLMTILAIAVGGMSLILFGSFAAFIQAGLETDAVEQVGHLTVFRKGYFDYGAGNPTAYDIASYREIIDLIKSDRVLGPLVNVVTPTVSLSGIAGNSTLDTSKTFLGVGYVPGDRSRMQQWDEYGIDPHRNEAITPLSDGDETVGIVGIGMARVLGLCSLIPDQACASQPDHHGKEDGISEDGQELAALAALAVNEAAPVGATNTSMPRLDLLTATASGAPNVVAISVVKAEPQGPRELDENMLLLNFSLAQKLLYGRSTPKATAIVLQLKSTKDLAIAKTRLNALFSGFREPLEVRDFTERQPFYKQAVGMFDTIFMFITAIMGLIVAFTVVNTTGMSVVERTTEIGTARAMGQRRSVIRHLFVMEGALLGALGATLGVVLGEVGGRVFNGLGQTWTPPGNVTAVPLEVLTTHITMLRVGAWIGLVVIATLASLLAANRAAKLEVVTALRHV